MILRDYCVDWIIGWAACWIAFMSMFFTLEKLVFKSGSTPPRYLFDTFSSIKLLILFLIAIPTPFRHLVDRSSFCFWIWCVVPRYLLDTLAVDDHFLDTYLNSFLDTSWHLHLSRFTEGLYILSSRFVFHFFDLFRSVRTCSSPKHSLSHSKPLPLWFFKLFQDSSSLGKFLISHSSFISCFET